MSIYKKMRLDRILVDRGLALTRSRAADLIRLGAVSVDGERALKPGAMIEPGARLIVDAQGSPFVSRGGLKLAARSTPSASTPRASSRSISALPQEASPRCSWSAEQAASTPSMSGGNSCMPNSGTTPAWWGWKGWMRGARMQGRSRNRSAPWWPMSVSRRGPRLSQPSSVPKVIMVSCNPGTCARDLRILFDGGYHITRVVLVDQFLFSPHIELVAVLER